MNKNISVQCINTWMKYPFSLILGLGNQIFIDLSASVKQDPIGDPFIATCGYSKKVIVSDIPFGCRSPYLGPYLVLSQGNLVGFLHITTTCLS